MKTTVVRRSALLVCLLATVGSAAAAPAAAPLKVTFPVDFSTPIPELSAVCGFKVSFGISGAYKGTIYTSQKSGAIVRELDTQPGTRISYSSPTTGKSFTFPFSTTFHYEFPNGTAPGAPAIVTANGFREKFPGLPASAGRVVFRDAVVLLVIDGVPYVDYGTPTSSTGRTNDDGDAIDAAICKALAP